MAIVTLPTDRITDWASFHRVCQEVFGFPTFYGYNMNAWIDCLTYVREGDGMSRFALGADDYLDVHVPDSSGFRSRAPDVFEAMIDCVGSVNRRNEEMGMLPPIRIVYE